MKAVDELARTFLERLCTAMRDWAEANRGAIGDKWYKHIVKSVKRTEKNRNPRIPEVMGFALWCLNTVANLGVMAGVGPNEYKLLKVPEGVDEKQTKRLLSLIAASLSLQYLPSK